MLKRRWGKRLFLVTVFVFSVASYASTPAIGDPASRLGEMLGQVDHIEGFFVSRTEKYVYSIDQIEREASLRIYKACGTKCRIFADDVVRYLRKAEPSKCQGGQENALLKIGDKGVIIYRHRGLHIEFDGSCYINKTPANYNIERSNWWFH